MKISNEESAFEELRYYAGRWPVILHDGVMVVIAWFGSYWFRFNLDTIPQPFLDQAVAMLPLVLLIHVAMSLGFLFLGVHGDLHLHLTFLQSLSRYSLDQP